MTPAPVIPAPADTPVIPGPTGTPIIPGPIGTPVIPAPADAAIPSAAEESPATFGTPVIPSLTGTPVIPGPTGNLPLSHDISDYPEGIVLAIDKPYRWTSADVIRKLKWMAIRHFGKKNLKVGHAGTLDPLATGVLLVCIGNACKRAQELQDHDKEYIARIRFGATTPSYDLEKDVDRRFPYEHISADAVRAALPAFLGEQEQVAPLFSAKSIDGVRAYELARKLYKASRRATTAQAIPVTAQAIPVTASVIPSSTTSVIPSAAEESPFDSAALETLHRSRITISELELLEFRDFSTPLRSARNDGGPVPGDGAPARNDGGPVPGCSASALSDWADGLAVIPSERSESSVSRASSRINVADTSAMGLPEAVIRIVCSKGTYIRAFARDLGEALGSGAHLSGLIRSRSGDFRLEDALSVDQALALLQQP